jgi:Trk K+ transport system NAD-binding subunit
MTARALNPGLFVVARENHEDNAELFAAVGADIVMHPSLIVADRIRVLLATPLLSEFEKLARYQDDAWACQLVSRIVALVHEQVPEVWEARLDDENAHAVCEMSERGGVITLGALLRDPRDRERALPAIALMLAQDDERELLPAEERRLRPGDRLLLCGLPCARSRTGWTLQNTHSLSYVLTGGSSPEGAVWRWISRLRGGTARAADG